MPIQNITPNVIQAAQFRIKFRDIFKLKEFYKAVHFWLDESEWSSTESDGKKPEGKDHFETLYLEKQGGKGEKEIWWWWRLQKIPTGNSYYKYHLDFDAHVLYMFPAEIMRDGKKFKVDNGEVEMVVSSYIQFDYAGEWSSHPILRSFNKVFPRRIFFKDLYDNHKLELYRETYVLQNFIKKWFKLQTFLPYEQTAEFHPSWAYPGHKKE